MKVSTTVVVLEINKNIWIPYCSISIHYTVSSYSKRSEEIRRFLGGLWCLTLDLLRSFSNLSPPTSECTDRILNTSQIVIQLNFSILSYF